MFCLYTFPFRPGKSCKLSSSGKFRILQCPQNSVICDKERRETCVSNVGVALWNPQILMAYPQSIAVKPQFKILNPSFFILLPPISFIKPLFSIINSSSSIRTQDLCRPSTRDTIRTANGVIIGPKKRTKIT